ncbi:hypothetical protein AB205_0074560 [Aquarana catesbeiana]|uniref:Uncharacterized protein n=1 Tax=Aquarana catesbeiana TaxID=8400 RepID=A0A2G9S3L0_AQUCT|nr:hypothetical protein AB205_0074560 [Aquarana catesbeiana]
MASCRHFALHISVIRSGTCSIAVHAVWCLPLKNVCLTMVGTNQILMHFTGHLLPSQVLQFTIFQVAQLGFLVTPNEIMQTIPASYRLTSLTAVLVSCHLFTQRDEISSTTSLPRVTIHWAHYHQKVIRLN